MNIYIYDVIYIFIVYIVIHTVKIYIYMIYVRLWLALNARVVIPGLLPLARHLAGTVK